jgi:endonuclease G
LALLPYVIPYDPNYLGDGFTVPLPTTCCTGSLAQGGRPLDYIYYSLVLHAERRTAVYTAHNVDGNRRRKTERNDRWTIDSRAPSAQLGEFIYSNNHWDRGHLVRRDDLSFGNTDDEAQAASDATFFYSNAAPQHERFNQDEWLALENWLLNKAKADQRRLCVFTGPLYTRLDLTERGARIPSAFWKVVVMRDPTADGDDLTVAAFLMKQNELWDSSNGAKGLDLKIYQVGLRELSRAAGLDFGELAAVDDYEWRQVRRRDRRKMPWIEIRSADDIELPGARRRAAGVRALRAVGYPIPGDARGATGCGCHTTRARDDGQRAMSQEMLALHEMIDAVRSIPEIGARSGSLTALGEQIDRIVGGTRVQPGAFPHCVCIGALNARGEFDGFCTGVVISPRVVLTAAHCASDITHVRTGIESVLQTQGKTIKAHKVIVHPHYDGDATPSHDICVVILEEDAGVPPVAVATTAQMAEPDQVMLVGFGFNDPVRPWGFGVKRQALVDITPPPGSSAGVVREDEQIAGYDNLHELHAGRRNLGIDSCNGDSGGPAYVSVDGEVAVAAITSRATQDARLPCGDGGIYTRIAPYLPWIGEVTAAPGGGLSAATPAARLWIAAVMANPAGDDRGREWVELRNDSAAEIALTGWSLRDAQGGTEALSGTVAARSTRRVTLPAGSRVQLSNREDTVSLLNGSTVVHEISWSTTMSDRPILGAAPAPGPVPDDTDDGTIEADWNAEAC